MRWEVGPIRFEGGDYQATAEERNQQDRVYIHIVLVCAAVAAMCVYGLAAGHPTVQAWSLAVTSLIASRFWAVGFFGRSRRPGRWVEHGQGSGLCVVCNRYEKAPRTHRKGGRRR